MKKIFLFIIVFVLLFVPNVNADNSDHNYTPDEIPRRSYIIGTQLFTSPDNEIYNTEGNEDAIYDESGVIYTHAVMFASRSIQEEDYDDMVFYYKNRSGNWEEAVDETTISSSSLPNYFYITHVNGICILTEGCGASTARYSVNFYDNNELKGTVPVSHGNKVEASEVPSVEKTGYKFTCWTENLDAQNVTCYNFGVVTAPVNLYAYYEPINLKLTYHYKGANGNDITSNTYTCNVANSDNDVCKFNIGQNLPTVPIGYVFVGWSTKPNSDEHVYKSGDSLISLASGSNNVDIDLYAVYKPIEYKVSYTLNGGSYEGTLTTTYTKTTSAAVEFGFEPVKTGYKIATNGDVQVTGGSYDKENKKITITTPNASATHTNLVAVTWTKNSYTIKMGNATVGSCRYDEECSVDSPQNVPDGKEFVGYSIGNANNPVLFVNKVKNLTTSEEAVTVYPHYKDIEYVIDYNLDGGVLPDNANLTHSFTINNKNVTLPTLSKIGYNFTGWKISGNNNLIAPGSYTINATSDVTFTAQFTKITYNIYYDNGSTSGGTCNVDSCVINKSYSTTGNNEFVGWGNAETNPTYVFKNNSSVSIKLIHEIATGTGNTRRVDLYHRVVNKGDIYAVITYDLNGGTFTSPSSVNSRFVITNGAYNVTLPSVNNKVGYEFNGWEIRNRQTGTVLQTIPLGENPSTPLTYNISQDVVAVVRWKAITSTVTLHDNDDHTCQFSYQYGDPAIKLEDKIDPTNCSSFVDENLIGWAISSTGNLYYGRDVLINNITSNTDFYAVYDATVTPIIDTYEIKFFDETSLVGHAYVDVGGSINSSGAYIIWEHEFEGLYDNVLWQYEDNNLFTFDSIVNEDMNVYVATDDLNAYTVTFYKGFNAPNVIGVAVVSSDCNLDTNSCVVWTDELDEGYSSSSVWHTSANNINGNIFDWSSAITGDMNLYTQRLG